MNRPSYTRLGVRPKEVNPKTKMLLLILKRCTTRALTDYLSCLKRYSQSRAIKLKRMEQVHSAYMKVCFVRAWAKLKQNAPAQRCKGRILKDVFVLSKRIEKASLRHAFDRLHKNIYVCNTGSVKRIMAARGSILHQMLRKICARKKKEALLKLNQNLLGQKLSKRLLTVNFILKSATRRHLLEAWNRMVVRGTSSQINDSHQLQNLQLQVQDLKIQVQNKNSNICRLQDQIVDLRQHSSYKPPESTSFIYYTNTNRSYAGLQKSKSNKFNSSFDKDSNQGSLAKDPSFGSLLGGSFASYRSKGSLSKANMNDSNASKNNCNCGYKERYEKYKATNETLKKQLEIIKTELEFTKDMNEHMENQIRVHLGDSQKDHKIDKLRQDLKQSHREREVLKEKVLKYEKYINKLKMQFKAKIEQIYRRVKKSN